MLDSKFIATLRIFKKVFSNNVAFKTQSMGARIKQTELVTEQEFPM